MEFLLKEQYIKLIMVFDKSKNRFRCIYNDYYRIIFEVCNIHYKNLFWLLNVNFVSMHQNFGDLYGNKCVSK